MAHDADYFRRRAAEARSAAFHKDDCEGVEVAGQLALAYAALARRRTAPPIEDRPDAVDEIAVSVPDAEPLILRD
jgi:hypothetical protein